MPDPRPVFVEMITTDGLTWSTTLTKSFCRATAVIGLALGEGLGDTLGAGLGDALGAGAAADPQADTSSAAAMTTGPMMRRPPWAVTRGPAVRRVVRSMACFLLADDRRSVAGTLGFERT
jgi:hypothetical protein